MDNYYKAMECLAIQDGLRAKGFIDDYLTSMHAPKLKKESAELDKTPHNSSLCSKIAKDLYCIHCQRLMDMSDHYFNNSSVSKLVER